MDDGIVLSQGIQDLAMALTFENLCPVTRMMMQESEWSDDEINLTAWCLFVRRPTDQSTVTWIMNNMELGRSRISIEFLSILTVDLPETRRIESCQWLQVGIGISLLGRESLWHCCDNKIAFPIGWDPLYVSFRSFVKLLAKMKLN